MPSSPLWVLYTLVAAAAQTARNAMQRDLIGALGAVGAAQVRFLFGLPFASIFFLVALTASGEPAPTLGASTLAWTVFGATAQVVATTMMLAAMRARSFVVVVAYTKTEAAQVALFGLVALGEKPTAVLAVSIALASVGVALLSWPKRGAVAEGGWRAAGLGLASAAGFALAAVSFRAAITGVATPSRLVAASLILVVGLAAQAGMLALHLALFDRKGARAILKAWRGSLIAGFMGAFASQMWFLAFAETAAARVRTLALVEVLFAQVASQRLFREPVSLRDALGMALIVAAAAILIVSGG